VIVVDANIVVYLLTANERTEEARRLWAADHDWWAPRLLVYELANLFARLVRSRAVSLETGITALNAGVRIVRVPEQEPPPGRILEVASRLDLSAYDASYLAIAERLRAPLITEDERLLRAAPGIAQSLAEAV
jgi:predicted nucleic acid-binding protein